MNDNKSAIIAKSESGVDIYAPLSLLEPTTPFDITDWPGKEIGDDGHGARYYQEKVALYDGKYSGEFDKYNQLRTGMGTMKYNTGETYEGWWLDGLREGLGRLVTPSSTPNN